MKTLLRVALVCVSMMAAACAETVAPTPEPAPEQLSRMPAALVDLDRALSDTFVEVSDSEVVQAHQDALAQHPGALAVAAALAADECTVDLADARIFETREGLHQIAAFAVAACDGQRRALVSALFSSHFEGDLRPTAQLADFSSRGQVSVRLYSLVNGEVQVRELPSSKTN